MADKKPKDQQAQDVTQTEGAPKPADELAQLREILFGQTNRAFRADLSALESRVNLTRLVNGDDFCHRK